MEEIPPRPDVIVPGEKVYLGPIRRDLARVYQRWMNDLEVVVTLTVLRRVPLTEEDELDWFDAARRDTSSKMFTIYERPDDRPVGNIGLHEIDFQSGTSEVGIVIGERSVWGRGYATEALSLLVDYAFTVLGLNQVWLRYVAMNERARQVYDRVGFREAGRLREAVRVGQRRYDLVFMDLLAREFRSPVLAEKLRLPRDGA
ncbi:GNAT family N-acetyltransferase [Thermomicrobiaceae bacterium CFH 74404]|uniref:GNAT family N-acetyltransferase n=1 Tax=Thermalbibacter longus TaxID=2951981 RepID=A0AA41WFQ9_9BACT|nr:GNAT family protein [Thermalbibacter longus]MCM8749560.1 GNAT family N-acetyltransferase [Thermalbibacter longus]